MLFFDFVNQTKNDMRAIVFAFRKKLLKRHRHCTRPMCRSGMRCESKKIEISMLGGALTAVVGNFYA